MAIDPKFLKPIDSLIEAQQEKNILTGLSSYNLTYSLCDRTDPFDYGSNYFLSFNLPFTQSYFPTGCTLSLRYPELQQLNVDQIIVAPIPSGAYSELIDGRTITMNVPQYTGTSSNLSAITLYSSTYTGDNVLKYENNPLIGSNVAFLFSDAINRPYTGLSTSDTGDIIDHSGISSWGYGLGVNDFLKKPSATSYKEVQFTYNTDTRTPHYSVNVGGSTYPNGRAGYNYDIPVGFIALDEGFVVLTHTAITSNFPWTSGYTQSNSQVQNSDAYPPNLNVLKNIYFTGVSNGDMGVLGPKIGTPCSSIEFFNIDTAFKITAVCLALPRQFYISNNPTWNKDSAIVNLNEDSGFISFDPLYVSELGLYNSDNELIAVAKTSVPIDKDYTSVVTFNCDIEF